MPEPPSLGQLLFWAVPTVAIGILLNWLAETFIVTTIAMPDIPTNGSVPAADAEHIQRLILPDLNWSGKLSPYELWQQFGKMGITGREYYFWFNLIDSLVYQWLANKCLRLGLQAVFLRWEQLSLRGGRRADLSNKPLPAYLRLLMDLARLELISDSIENICVFVTLLLYGTRVNWILVLLAVITPIKWMSVAGCLLAIIIGLGLFLKEYLISRRRIRGEKQRKA